MILNSEKTKIFVINPSQNYQFTPRMRVPGANTDLEVVYTTKLVGVTLTSDLKFHQHVNNMVKSANSKLWMLRHLKQFEIKSADLIEIYTTFIRSRLEYCVAVWNPSLTEDDKKDIERIQKTAIKIITGDPDLSYEESLKLVNLKTLEKRREELCLDFAITCVQSENHSQLFKPNENALLHHPTKFQPPFCLNERYKKSTIPYLIN